MESPHALNIEAKESSSPGETGSVNMFNLQRQMSESEMKQRVAEGKMASAETRLLEAEHATAKMREEISELQCTNAHQQQHIQLLQGALNPAFDIAQIRGYELEATMESETRLYSENVALANEVARNKAAAENARELLNLTQDSAQKEVDRLAMEVPFLTLDYTAWNITQSEIL